MKRTLTIVCGFACFICLISSLASAQEALSQEFEKAKTFILTQKNPGSAPDIQPPALRPVEPGHELGNVTGTDIAMKVYDHAVAGAVNGAVVWGFFNEAVGSAQLRMRKYGQEITAEFKRQPDKSYGGVITSADDSSRRSTSVFLAGVDAANRTFKLRINEEEVTVLITPEGISNGHFVNPTYSTVLGGKPVSYRIEVVCCLGYSINMSMIILSAYAH